MTAHSAAADRSTVANSKRFAKARQAVSWGIKAKVSATSEEGCIDQSSKTAELNSPLGVNRTGQLAPEGAKEYDQPTRI
jgi:hypothetical protein